MAFRHIDSYFKSEDEAMGALIKIQQLGGTKCLIEELSDDEDNTMLPIFASAGSTPALGGGISGSGAGGVTGATGIVPGVFTGGLFSQRDDNEARHALLSFHIPEEKEAQSLKIITENGGWSQ